MFGTIPKADIVMRIFIHAQNANTLLLFQQYVISAVVPTVDLTAVIIQTAIARIIIMTINKRR